MGKNHLTKTIHYKKNYYTSNRKSTMDFFYKFLLLTFLFIAINGRPQGWQGQGWQGQGLQGQGLQGQSLQGQGLQGQSWQGQGGQGQGGQGQGWQGQGWQGQGWRGQSNQGNRDPVHTGTLNGGNHGAIGGQHHHGSQGSGQLLFGPVNGNPVYNDTRNGACACGLARRIYCPCI